MEAILVIQKKKGAVRCVDVAEQLKVTKPSVSRAVKELEKMGHVSRDEDGSVALTPSGERIAAEIYERHRFFTQRLIAAGVDPETGGKGGLSYGTRGQRRIVSKTEGSSRRLREGISLIFLHPHGYKGIYKRRRCS